jgi:hypothetical protein
VITNGAGTVERHTVFEKFPDMILRRTLEGAGESGAELRSAGASGEELVFHGADGALVATHVSASTAR